MTLYGNDKFKITETTHYLFLIQLRAIKFAMKIKRKNKPRWNNENISLTSFNVKISRLDNTLLMHILT